MRHSASMDGLNNEKTRQIAMARAALRGRTSKYDMVKVKVFLGDHMQHHYVLSRFLISRMLTVTRIPNGKATKIALDLKKHLVDNNLLEVKQAEMEAILFRLMDAKGFGAQHVSCYRLVSSFMAARQPLIILLCGAPWTGKSTITQQLAARLNMPNVLRTELVYTMLRDGGLGPHRRQHPPSPPFSQAPLSPPAHPSSQQAHPLPQGPSSSQGLSQDPPPLPPSIAALLSAPPAQAAETLPPTHTTTLFPPNTTTHPLQEEQQAQHQLNQQQQEGQQQHPQQQPHSHPQQQQPQQQPHSHPQPHTQEAKGAAASMEGLHRQPVYARSDLRSDAEVLTEFQRECVLVQQALEGDLNKAMKDGKPLILEGCHLDPGLLLQKLTAVGLVMLPASGAEEAWAHMLEAEGGVEADAPPQTQDNPPTAPTDHSPQPHAQHTQKTSPVPASSEPLNDTHTPSTPFISSGEGAPFSCSDHTTASQPPATAATAAQVKSPSQKAAAAAAEIATPASPHIPLQQQRQNNNKHPRHPHPMFSSSLDESVSTGTGNESMDANNERRKLQMAMLGGVLSGAEHSAVPGGSQPPESMPSIPSASKGFLQGPVVAWPPQTHPRGSPTLSNRSHSTQSFIGAVGMPSSNTRTHTTHTHRGSPTLTNRSHSTQCFIGAAAGMHRCSIPDNNQTGGVRQDRAQRGSLDVFIEEKVSVQEWGRVPGKVPRNQSVPACLVSEGGSEQQQQQEVIEDHHHQQQQQKQPLLEEQPIEQQLQHLSLPDHEPSLPQHTSLPEHAEPGALPSPLHHHNNNHSELPPPVHESSAAEGGGEEQRHNQPQNQQQNQQQEGSEPIRGGSPKSPESFARSSTPMRAIQPLIVPIILQMPSEIEHALMAEDCAPDVQQAAMAAMPFNYATPAAQVGGGSTGNSNVGGSSSQSSTQPLAPCIPLQEQLLRVRHLQQYFTSFETQQGVPVVQVKYGSFGDTVDMLHKYILTILCTAMEWMQEDDLHHLHIPPTASTS